MANEEKQQAQEFQKTFAPAKKCKIITERYLITVFYYSNRWQSVTVYEKHGKKYINIFHGTFCIDVNKNKKELFSYNCNYEELPKELLEDMVFMKNIYDIVYDTMRWLECWKEVEEIMDYETPNKNKKKKMNKKMRKQKKRIKMELKKMIKMMKN